MPLVVLKGLREGVSKLAFSPDDKYLAAISVEHVLAIWDTSNGQQVYSRKFDTVQEVFAWDQRVGQIQLGQDMFGIYNMVTANVKHVLVHRFEPNP